MPKQIVVEVNEDTGEIKLETLGFKGKDCITESQWVKDLLGSEISRQLTPTYYMKEDDKVTKKRFLPLCG
jgi:hypothetical protein